MEKIVRAFMIADTREEKLFEIHLLFLPHPTQSDSLVDLKVIKN